MRQFNLSVVVLVAIALLGGCDDLEEFEQGKSHVSIGITSRGTPYLNYSGPGRLTYTHGGSDFTISITTLSGKSMGKITGSIYAEDETEIVEISADLKYPIRVEILGMKVEATDPPNADPTNLVMPKGVSSAKISGTFEYTYDWD